MASPCRAMVASRMMALSSAWRWISVSMTSGASRVKAPSPLMGRQLTRVTQHEDGTL